MKNLLKNKCTQIFMVFATVFCFFYMSQTDVKAATPAPSGLVQTNASESSVEVKWNATFGGDMWYYWRISDTNTFANNKSGRESHSDYSDSSAYISGLKAGKTYYVQIGTSKTSASTAPADTAWSGVLSVVTRPESVTSTTITFINATETSISLNWAAVEGATGYTVNYWMSNASEANSSKVTTAVPNITVSGLNADTKYSFSIRPYKQGATYTATLAYGSTEYYVPTLPTKIYGVDCTSFSPNLKKGSITLDWDDNAVADGYEYEISKYNAKKVLAKGTSNYSGTYLNSKKLKTAQIYKVRVRGYVDTTNNQRAYGAWSDYDYISRCTAAGTKLKKTGNKIKASWKKVTGASGYTVYMATKYNGKYKKMGTTKKTSLTLKKAIKANNTYYVRVVPNYKKGKKTYHATVNSNSQYSAYAYYYRSGRFYSYSYN